MFRNFEIFSSEPPKVKIERALRVKVDLHLSWLTTENFKIMRHCKVVVYEVKTSSRHKEKQ